MKTIEQAAYDCSELFEHSSAHRISFLNGVEFAQRWIDISEEMPEVGEQILTKNGNNIGLSLPLTMWDIKDITEFATHWRPIELK